MRMRRFGIGLAAFATFTVAGSAFAQAPTDAYPPLPNVLLLVDTSGSMEYDISGNLPVAASDCDGSNGNYKSRWINLIEVLTGDIQNYTCFAHDREDSDFVSEFELASIAPYDQGYFLPYHRAVSNDCMFTPGNIQTTNMLGWAANPFGTRQFGAGLGTACTTAFDQSRTGILDTYRDRVRFGLFTFDARPDDGIGVDVGDDLNAQTGFDGHWSYFNNWESGGAGVTGHPPDCSIPNQIHEVGARNPAAPPWEGRMINFGSVFASLQENRDHNDRLQDTILALRPYGATPLAGQLADAEVFFRQDDMDDGYYNIANGFTTDEKFAPAQDPLLNNPSGSCRDGFIIVLSDGEPNLDMRPFCDALSATGATCTGGANNGMTCVNAADCPGGTCTPGIDGSCPYSRPADIVETLNTPSGNYPAIRTFAVGFGVSTVGMDDCETLGASDFDALNPGARCTTPAAGLVACCNLAEIAIKGGTGGALFADDVPSLKAALAAILDSVATQSTSRTTPSFVSASAVANNAEAVSYEFVSAFTPEPGDLWKGNIERKRWKCDTDMFGDVVAEIQPVDVTKGDNFAENIHSGAGPDREFWTAIPATNISTGYAEPTYSIRPNGSTLSDGLGSYGSPAGSLTGTAPTTPANIAAYAQAQPSALSADPTMPAECLGPDLIAANAGDCASSLMLWNLGQANGSLPDRVDNQLGAVYHSAPKAIGRPEALTADAAYAVFQRADETKASGPRPLVMYAQTVDGQLHAFKVATNNPGDPNPVNSLENNEIWSFIPPHALASIHAMYPNTPQILADGPIAIRDIPFERTAAQAAASSAPYRTVLVASGGQGGGYYYALDVTDPYNPTFLWQLSRDETGNRLFSDIAAGEPAIAMVGIGTGVNRREVAVAILPGGEGQPVAGSCGRQETIFDYIDVDINPTPKYQPRASTRCWQAGPSRSVTIVSLEDGEILRTFRGVPGDGPASITGSLVDDSDLDAPILGAVAFPNGTGQIANRAYLNDQDGTVWRIDMASTDPAAWRLDLLFDAYSLPSDVAADGQPIATLPVVALDTQGNTVVLFSTGDQEEFRSTTQKNRVWSVTEFPVAVGTSGRPFSVESNWYIAEDAIDGDGTGLDKRGMNPGEKVTGPIAVFNEVAYFSTLTPPPPTEACELGTGRLWGVRFISSDGDKVPDPAVLDPSLNPTRYKFDLPDNVNPFGVAVTAEPSCREEATETDDYVGKHAVASNTKRANYVLRFNTGSVGTPDAVDSTVNIASLDLPEPETTVTIDSWASIVE